MLLRDVHDIGSLNAWKSAFKKEKSIEAFNWKPILESCERGLSEEQTSGQKNFLSVCILQGFSLQ